MTTEKKIEVVKLWVIVLCLHIFAIAYSAPVGAEDVVLASKGWAQAANGVLKFYGSGDLSEWTHISDAALSDDDFSNGDVATAEIDLGDNPPNFFKAKVEER